MPLLETLPQGFTRFDKEGNPVKPRKEPVKKYLILLQGSDEDDRTWLDPEVFMPIQDTVNGVYQNEMGQMKSIHTEIWKKLEDVYENYNIVESHVFTNNTTMKDNISLYTFMRHVLETDSVVAAESSITIDDIDEIALSYGYDEEQRESLYRKESM